MPKEDLRPVTIEYMADKYHNIDFTFVTDTGMYKENTQTLPGVFVDIFETVRNPFWFLLKYPSEDVIKAYPQNRIPTIELIRKLYGEGIFKAYISMPEMTPREVYFSV